MFSALSEKIPDVRQEGELPPEMLGSSVARSVAAKRVASKFVSSEALLSLGLRRLCTMRTAPKCKRH